MTTIRLKGIASAKAKGKTYYYAWRGGPRLRGTPGSPEFVASYNEAVSEHRAPDTSRFRSLVTLYRASGEYKNLANSTKEKWSPWLDRIAEHFGDLRIAQFDRPEKIRPIIRQWRNRWVDKPRTADYALQVLSRALSYAVDPLGKIAGNPAEGVKRLYAGDRSDIIWTAKDIEHFKAVCSADLANVIDLAAHTGLRRGDLLKLSWGHVEEDAIIIHTSKSRHRREVIIPLHDDLRAILTRIPKLSATVLTNRKKPWTDSAIESAMHRTKATLGWTDRNLNFHDLRGTAATKFYVCGLSERVIAEILGWSEDNVSKIVRKYVGRNAAVKAVIAQLRTGQGT